MRKYLLIAVFLLSGLAQHAEAATTYYASPTGSTTASCIDSSANVCSIARAEAVAISGDLVEAACGTYALGATALTVNVNITMYSVTDKCATITGNNATAPVILTVANNANDLIFRGFRVIPDGGIASAASRSISLFTITGYTATVTVDSVYAESAANSAIGNNMLTGNAIIRNISTGGTTGAQGFIYGVNQATNGVQKVWIDGCSGSITTSVANTAAVQLLRSTSASFPMYIKVNNCNLNITVPTSIGATAAGRGIVLTNIAPAPDFSNATTSPLIENNVISIDASGGTSADSLGIAVGATNASYPAPFTIVRNNTVTCYSPACFGIAIGEGNIPSYVDYAQVYGNKVYGTYYNGSATPHGIRLGQVMGGHVYQNYVQGFAVGIIMSENSMGMVSGNIVNGAFYAGLYAKGTGATGTPTFSNNTVIIDDSFVGAKVGSYGCLSSAINDASFNTVNVNFNNNLCYIKSGATTTWKYVQFDSNQVGTFTNNQFYSEPTLAIPFTYNGSNYATLALWNALANVGIDYEARPDLNCHTFSSYTTANNCLPPRPQSTISTAGISSRFHYVPRYFNGCQADTGILSIGAFGSCPGSFTNIVRNWAI